GESCFITAPPGGDLGCRPIPPDPSEYACNTTGVTVTPDGGCTPSEVICYGGEPSVDENGVWSVTNTYAATCGEATCYADQTFTWTEGSISEPTFDDCTSGTTELGCNPT